MHAVHVWNFFTLYILQLCDIFDKKQALIQDPLMCHNLGPDGREQGTDHSHQPQGHHHGPAVWMLRPGLPRVVWWCPRCVIQSLCHINCKCHSATYWTIQFNFFNTVKSRYLEVDGTICYKFKLPEVQINLHFG